MKRMIALLLAVLMLLGITACGSKKTEEIDLANATWEEILEAAKGTTVTFYGWAAMKTAITG